MGRSCYTAPHSWYIFLRASQAHFVVVWFDCRWLIKHGPMFRGTSFGFRIWFTKNHMQKIQKATFICWTRSTDTEGETHTTGRIVPYWCVQQIWAKTYTKHSACFYLFILGDYIIVHMKNWMHSHFSAAVVIWDQPRVTGFSRTFLKISGGSHNCLPRRQLWQWWTLWPGAASANKCAYCALPAPRNDLSLTPRPCAASFVFHCLVPGLSSSFPRPWLLSQRGCNYFFWRKKSRGLLIGHVC